MLTRRLILSSLPLTIAASAALAQTKKSAGGANDTMQRSLAGRYRSEGRNPDGSAYSGTVTIAQQGQAVDFTWVIGTDTYRGTGQVDGRVVTVDWGEATPVIYVVMENGALHGTWDDGLALEKLTPR